MMVALTSLNALIEDEDFRRRVYTAALLVGVVDAHDFTARFLGKIAASKPIIEAYDKAVQAQAYEGAHGRIGFDPRVITDEMIISTVRECVTCETGTATDLGVVV
ncbi:hypothetical protein [Trueperella sp. LYQ143]|uniref:hypothetical protein n=1 Tax=unclassified Trueperella TaxID=2630174 RepID=UPI0039831774